MSSTPATRRRWPWLVVGIVALLAMGGAVGWAAATVLTPAEDALDSTSHTYVSVEQGAVGSSFQLNTIAEWSPVPVGTNRAAGVVTSIAVAPGDEVVPGSTLYSVNLRPVVVAQGDVPAFRSIGLDVIGPDVAQLQVMLTAGGFYNGDADGKAERGTVRAIKAWQKALGTEQSGVVELGDVVFVPTLPTRVALDDELVFRGATLVGGEEVVSGLPAAPEFELPVTEAQAVMMPAGTRVEITSPEADEWVGYVTEQTSEPETSTVVVALAGEGGSVVCGDQCGQIPVTGTAMLQSEVVTVGQIEGLVVPSAALVTSADGQLGVIGVDGAQIPVSVVAAARGMSVIEGISAGTRVRLPAESP